MWLNTSHRIKTFIRNWHFCNFWANLFPISQCKRRKKVWFQILQTFNGLRINLPKIHQENMEFWKNWKDAENFFEFLNCWHGNIRVTLEKESNKFFCHFLILLSKMKETVFQHQFFFFYNNMMLQKLKVETKNT